ncbi:MAG: mechanosensitive ion channel domain-containing protein, partial [Pseudomonadota bacterium]
QDVEHRERAQEQARKDQKSAFAPDVELGGVEGREPVVSMLNGGHKRRVVGHPRAYARCCGSVWRLPCTWRLVPLATRGVRIVRLSFLVATFVFFFDRALSVGAQIFGGDEELALTQSAIKALVMGLMFLWLSSKSVWTLAEGREEAFSPEIRGLWRNLRYALRLISILILVSTVIGYVSFGHYLATRTYMIDGLLAAGLFVRLIAQQGLKAADASFATTEEGSSEERRERLIFFWVGVVVDFIVIAALVPIIALILGAQLEDVRAGVSNAFFGFKIGGVTVSFLKILIAVGTFVGILLVTRFIQRTGERSFLPRTRLDTGVQNSLKTLIGYVGLIIAFGSAVSALGFNLSNLAIIAGALSVGIGFGLQSIVNNFVSGLILLFERPIKVGDWIVTSAGEGIVKRISVRSTEIETFDRSSVIVPNSELISNAVTNWTHKNKQGRVIISVGVSYDTDPDLVIKLLEEVARDTHILLAYPAPYVYFVGFGDSSLDFELRGLIRDVNSGLSAKTGLRVAIFKKLKDAGIEIPFPQRDLNIRTGLYQDKDQETIGDQSASGDEDVKQGTEPWRQIPEGA